MSPLLTMTPGTNYPLFCLWLHPSKVLNIHLDQFEHVFSLKMLSEQLLSVDVNRLLLSDLQQVLSCFPSFLSHLSKWLISTQTIYSVMLLMCTRMWEVWEEFHLPLCVCSRLKDSSSSKFKFTHIYTYYIYLFKNNCGPLFASTCAPSSTRALFNQNF